MINTINTITTIELSSLCNLKCGYCIQGQLIESPARDPGIMTDAIFERSLYWLSELNALGTQGIVNLNGNGESLIDPQIVKRVAAVVSIVGPERVQFCTNGILLTQELAYELAGAGIRRIDLSIHAPYAARRAFQYLYKAGIQSTLNPGPVTGTHNWAGQLAPEHCVEILPRIDCHPLIEGRAYILSEGDVTPCCYDFQPLGAFGHVNDDDLLSRVMSDYQLCATCHQTIPADLSSVKGVGCA